MAENVPQDHPSAKSYAGWYEALHKLIFVSYQFKFILIFNIVNIFNFALMYLNTNIHSIFLFFIESQDI